MEIFQAIILGIVQGITEWLPVSSSGHLVIFQELFGFGTNVSFDVLLHFATLLVILLVFWKDIVAIFKSLFSLKWDENTKLLLFIIIASVPIAIIGFVFHDFFIGLLTNLFLVGIFLVINGLVLFLTRFTKQNNNKSNKLKDSSKLNWWKSLVIGVAQAVALIPGISRSGATVSTGLFLGIKKKKLITFSFLMAVPAIIGATISEAKGLTMVNPAALILGSIAALIVGYFSLKFLIRIIEKGKMHNFSYYCVVLGIIVILVALIY
ncbi:undecaprenyl-diphosphate phosphatase [Candidatus Woesearchaeota archaeon]|nr:undecaprenyl-diphosphate phosphatase [Candidatus Woesearchaeota archaeon]